MKHTLEPLQINYGSPTDPTWPGVEIHAADSAEKRDGSRVIAEMTNDYLSADRADATAQRLVSCYNALAGLNPEGVAEAAKVLEGITRLETKPWPKPCNTPEHQATFYRQQLEAAIEAARRALAAVRQP